MAILIERKRRRRRKTFEAHQEVANVLLSSIQNDTNRIPIHVSESDSTQINNNNHSNDMNRFVRPKHQHCKVRPVKLMPSSAIQRGKSLLSILLLLLVSIAFTGFYMMNLSHMSSSSFLVAAFNTNGQQLSQPLSGSASSVIMSPPPTLTATTTSQKARYKTMYACEDRQLTMDCDYGFKINLIRANYGRFSIATCNEQGQLDLSTDCMSPITFRVVKERCQDKQKCSINATSSIFGDKCPKTRKYLEVHFQCQLDSSVSSTTFVEPLERVDLRNTSALQTNNHPVYSPSTVNAGGSSSILPPNNPAPQSYNNNQHQQSSLRPSTSSIPPANDESSVPLQPLMRPQQPQQPMTVMNSEILSYNVISDIKSIYNPNNISSEPTRAPESIVVTLRHTHTENMSNPRCVLWDQAANQWTERGSQIIESNLTHTVCAFDQATSYLLVMDYLAPYPTISQVNSLLFHNQQQQPPAIQSIATQPSVPSFGSPPPGILDLQPVALDPVMSNRNSAERQNHSSSSVGRFVSLFSYLLAFIFIAVAILTIAFIASTMKSSAGATLKSLGNFTAFSGPKYKNRRADGVLHNKDLLVINNQNGHQFLYAPANATKINSSSSTHILSGGGIGNQGTLHHIQQQQLYSGNGTLSNMSATGGQSNNYYYGLMGLNNLFQQQQQSQHQHNLSQHHLNQQQQQVAQQAVPPTSYLHQANKSTISNESANSTPSSSGVESGSTSIQQHQQQQSSCLVMNNEYNLMGHMANYDQQQNLMPSANQPTLTLNAHYSSSGVQPMSMTSNQLQHQRFNMNQPNSSVRDQHIYECVDDDKPYTARLLLPTTNINLSEQYNSQTLSQQQSGMLHNNNQQASSRTMTLSSRLLQNSIHQQQPNHMQQNNKRLFSHHPAIVRDNQTKTSIICSKMAQVTPQRATEINKFQHDVMAIYNGTDTTTTTTTTANSSSSGNSSTCYGRTELNGTGAIKLSTDC